MGRSTPLKQGGSWPNYVRTNLEQDLYPASGGQAYQPLFHAALYLSTSAPNAPLSEDRVLALARAAGLHFNQTAGKHISLTDGSAISKIAEALQRSPPAARVLKPTARGVGLAPFFVEFTQVHNDALLAAEGRMKVTRGQTEAAEPTKELPLLDPVAAHKLDEALLSYVLEGTAFWKPKLRESLAPDLQERLSSDLSNLSGGMPHGATLVNLFRNIRAQCKDTTSKPEARSFELVAHKFALLNLATPDILSGSVLSAWSRTHEEYMAGCTEQQKFHERTQALECLKHMLLREEALPQDMRAFVTAFPMKDVSESSMVVFDTQLSEYALHYRASLPETRLDSHALFGAPTKATKTRPEPPAAGASGTKAPRPSNPGAKTSGPLRAQFAPRLLDSNGHVIKQTEDQRVGIFTDMDGQTRCGHCARITKHPEKHSAKNCASEFNAALLPAPPPTPKANPPPAPPQPPLHGWQMQGARGAARSPGGSLGGGITPGRDGFAALAQAAYGTWGPPSSVVGGEFVGEDNAAGSAYPSPQVVLRSHHAPPFPAAVHPQAPSPSLAGPSPHAPPAVLDSGCAPYHCIAGRTPSRGEQVHIQGMSEAAPPVRATVTSHALSVRGTSGRVHHMLLPGQSVSSPEFGFSLVSLHELLRAGFSGFLSPEAGELVTPYGYTLPLTVRDGLWHFPVVSGQPCAVTNQEPPPGPPRASALVAAQGRSTNVKPATSPAAPPPSPVTRQDETPASEPPQRRITRRVTFAAARAPKTGERRMSPPPPQPASEDVPEPPQVPASPPPPGPDNAPEPSQDTASHAPAAKDLPDSAEPVHLARWDALHCLHAHAGWRRLLKVALGMLPDDPNRPSLRYLRKWREGKRCLHCLQGDATRPPHRAAHPARARRDAPLPGECLCVDSSGAYASDSDNATGAVLGGYTHSWIFADDASDAIVSIPGKTSTCTELLSHIQDYQAASGTRLRTIMVDLAYLCEPLQSWCRTSNVKLLACARGAHQTNGRSENSVKVVKRLTRINNAQAGTPSARLQPYAHACAAQFHNRTPSSTGPSPLTLWPAAPWQYPSSALHPWGCRVVGWVGKQTSDPNLAMRGAAGIYLGLNTQTTGYLVYHPDTDVVHTYPYIEARTPHVFPIKDMQWAGELSPPDGCLDPDSWRRHASRHLHDVDDGPAAEFLAGKQVCFDLPVSCYPTFAHSWRVQCLRPVYTRSGDRVILMQCQFTRYNGGVSALSPAQLKDIGTLVDIPMSLPKGAATTLPSTALRGTTLREALRATYPAFSTLGEYAHGSAVLQGPAAPNVLPSPPLAVPALTARPLGNRIALPARCVGGARSPSATWAQPVHHVLPARVPVTIAGRAYSARPSRAAPGLAISISSSGAVGFEPKNYKQARAHGTWPLWETAIRKEISGLERRHTWDVVHESSLPHGTNVLHSKLVFKDKRLTGAKARLVVRGDMQYPKLPASATYSGTPTAQEVRVLIALATQRRWGLHSCDISQAFLQAEPLAPDTHIYVRPPPGLNTPPGTVWKLRRHLYGLSASPKAWTDTLRAFLISEGFTSVNSSDSMYAWSDGADHIQLCFHVDDILIAFSDDRKAQLFKHSLLSRFEGTDDGPVHRYVGVDITQTPSGQTFLSQASLARELLEEQGLLDCNPAITPLPAATLLRTADRSDPPDAALRAQYGHVVGTLQYLATWTRPDLAFPVSQLGRHLIAPGPLHMSAARHVLRYLRGTLDLGILYSPDLPDPNRLISFADADFATCPDTRRSVGANVHLLNGGAVSWKTKLQGGVATSTSEAEFVSASKAADEVVWLRRILTDLGAPQPTPTPLFEDNRSARVLSETSSRSERSKHIDFRIFALRDRVAAGVVSLVDCPTFDMVADLFTKNLPSPSYLRHRDTILGFRSHTAPALPAHLSVASS